MKNKILYITVAVIVIGAFIIAAIYIGKNKDNEPSGVITSVKELSLVNGYDEKNTTVLYDNFHYKVVGNTSVKGFSLIDYFYNIIEPYQERFIYFVKNYDNSLSDYYYFINDTVITIKQDGKLKYEFDIGDYRKTDFNVVNIYSPFNNKIFMIFFSDNKYQYVLYDTENQTFKSFESEDILQMIGLSNKNYILNNDALISLDNLEALAEKYSNSSIKGTLDEEETVYESFSTNYIIMKDNNDGNNFIVDVSKDGKKVTNNKYSDIINISSNDKYFVNFNDNKYTLYDMSETAIFESLDRIIILRNFILIYKNNTITIYDLNLKKVKDIDFNQNGVLYAINRGNNIIIYYTDSENVGKSFAIYNSISDTLIKGNARMIEHNGEINAITRENNKTQLLFNNFKDTFETDDKVIFKSSLTYIKGISKDNKKYCFSAIDDNYIEHFYTIYVDENKLYSVNYYDCMNFDKKPKIDYDLNNIVLQNNGKADNKKIENINQVNSDHFMVKYADNVWLYKFVK